MQEAMDKLRQVSPEVVAAAVIGVEGEVLACSTQGDLDGVIGPMATTLSTMALRAAQELGRGALETSILEGAEGRIVLRELGDGRVLVVVADPSAHLGLLLDDVRACSDEVTRGVAYA